MQKSFTEIQEEELNLATKLYEMNILKGPTLCK